MPSTSMDDQNKTEETKTDEVVGEAAAAPERRDEEGLPLDRKPTLDDVRGTEGSGRATAVGCTVLVLIAVAAFWVLRIAVMGP